LDLKEDGVVGNSEYFEARHGCELVAVKPCPDFSGVGEVAGRVN